VAGGIGGVALYPKVVLYFTVRGRMDWCGSKIAIPLMTSNNNRRSETQPMHDNPGLQYFVCLMATYQTDIK